MLVSIFAIRRTLNRYASDHTQVVEADADKLGWLGSPGEFHFCEITSICSAAAKKGERERRKKWPLPLRQRDQEEEMLP